MSAASVSSGYDAHIIDPNHPLSLELKSLRSALARFQDEAHDAAIKLQRHSLESINDHERMQHLQHDNDLLRNEVEMLRATPHPDASPSTHPSALQAQQLTISLRRLSDKLTATEETLLTRTTELAHAMSEAARAKLAEEGAYALASSARGREEEGKVRERDLQLQLREAQEQARMSDLVVNEYASLVRTMEGRASNPLYRPSTPRTPSTPGSPASSPNDPSSSQLSLQSSGSSRSLTSSLHEGKMGLKKLLSEFSGEIQRLEAEIARLHGELAISETKLQAEKQNAANDREALARARHDLERHRLDDASAAKMVSRYMKFSQSSTDTLQRALAALKTRHQTTVDTLSAQLASASHQRRAAETTASRLRDALDELGRDAMREAFGRRREVALRMQIIAQQEVIRGHLVRLVQNVGESMRRGETGVEVLSRLLEDAQGLVEQLDGRKQDVHEGEMSAGSVQRILAAQHAVDSLVEELQAETTRRIQLETLLPTTSSALGLQGGDSASPSLITPLSLDMALPGEASTPTGIASAILPSVALASAILPPVPGLPSTSVASDTPAAPEAEQTTPGPSPTEVAPPAPPLSGPVDHDGASSRGVGADAIIAPDLQAPRDASQASNEVSPTHEQEHERTPQTSQISLPASSEDAKGALLNDTQKGKLENTQKDDTPPIPTLNMIAPTPIAVAFPTGPLFSGGADALQNSAPSTPTGQPERANAQIPGPVPLTPPDEAIPSLPKDLIAPSTDITLPFVNSAGPRVSSQAPVAFPSADVTSSSAHAALSSAGVAASSPHAASSSANSASLPSAEVEDLFSRLSRVTHRYDRMQAEFRDCHAALQGLKQDVASFTSSSGPSSLPYNPSSLAAAIQRIDDYAEDARVELEIRAADDALAVRGLSALLTLPGALAPTAGIPGDQRPTLADTAAQITAFTSDDGPSASTTTLARKLADVQHDISAVQGAVGALHGVQRPTASPTFGHVMTTPSLRRTPSLKQLGGLGNLGLRVPMPAFVMQDTRAAEEHGQAAPRARTLSAMYMLGVGLRGRGVGGSPLPGTPSPRRVSTTPRPPMPPPESDSELESEAETGKDELKKETGDETTFQSFPTDLQQHLSRVIPPNSRYTVQSSLYPTYKSVKPISTCTKNFLEWLNTQPPGYVILMAHSMGGLLAAEAATHASNNPQSYPGARPSRIIGMIAFDVPFLGMHPHVVITGLASLFAKDDDKKTETQLNDQHPDVHMVDGRVTDDWESYKRNMAERYSASSLNLPSPSRSPSPPSPNLLGPTRAEMSPFPPSYESSIRSSSTSSLHSSSTSFAERAGGLLAQADGFIASKADEPLVRWARKHRADPFGAGKTWLIDHFQFGACMFDPPGLTKRYRQLVAWNGQWVNYWTETVPKASRGSSPGSGSERPSLSPSASSNSASLHSNPALDRRQDVVDNDLALLGKGTAELSLDTLSKAGYSAASTISSNDSPFVTPCGSPNMSRTPSPIPLTERPPPLPPRRSSPIPPLLPPRHSSSKSTSSIPPLPSRRSASPTPPLPPRRPAPAAESSSNDDPPLAAYPPLDDDEKDSVDEESFEVIPPSEASESVENGVEPGENDTKLGTSQPPDPPLADTSLDPADAKARKKEEKARQKAEKEVAKAAEKEGKARAKEEQAREKERVRQEKARAKEDQEQEKERAKREKELTKQREAEQKQLAKQQKELAKRDKQGKESKRDKSYHFVVLPTGLGQILGGAEHWESVPIAGVDDEVAAHCGLFIRGQNLDYDGLVERVGRKVLEICDKA
uniref:GPI inositol-deacylase n=1 Tax=Schizophyllum commune (strain H4-8 / FGSC 9210) TaxID=578458 RepID=D8Q000_SCHCM